MKPQSLHDYCCCCRVDSERSVFKLHPCLLHPQDYVCAQRIAPVIRFMFAQHKFRLVIIALAVLLCAVDGCGGPSHDIVSKWRMSQDANAMVWEFSGNGAVLIGNTRGRDILGRNRVKIETPFARTVYQMAI